MRDKIKCLLENAVRSYGRRQIAWRLYVYAVQEQRLDDEPLPSDSEINARARHIEALLYREHFMLGKGKVGKP